jgi:hypothetical protein
MSALGKALKPIIFTVSSLGTGILYSLIASETNEYFEDDNTATSWMVSIFISSLLLLLVMQTDGCGETLYIQTGRNSSGQTVSSMNRLTSGAYASVIGNLLLSLFYFMTVISNPSFKRKNFFVFGAIMQFLVLASGWGLWMYQRNLVENRRAGVAGDSGNFNQMNVVQPAARYREPVVNNNIASKLDFNRNTNP